MSDMTHERGDDRFDALMADISAEVAAADGRDDLESARAMVAAEDATVELAARLRASERVGVDVGGVGRIDGVIEHVNAEVCVLAGQSALGERIWIVPLRHIVSVDGLAHHFCSASIVDARLGFAAILRQWCAQGRLMRCWFASARPEAGRSICPPDLTGTLARVGRDHCDVWVHGETESAGPHTSVITLFLPQVSAMCSP